MACCAFAVLLLVQLLAPLAWLWGWLPGRGRHRTNAAVAWSPGRVPGTERARPAVALRPGLSGHRRRGWLALGALELALLGVLAAFALETPASSRREPAEPSGYQALYTYWCRSVEVAGAVAPGSVRAKR